MLVPAFSLVKLRTSHAYKECIVRKATWNHKKPRWDVKFAGKVKRRELVYLFRANVILLLGTLINAISFVVIGGISKYQKGYLHLHKEHGSWRGFVLAKDTF
jgi:hypothetical protein